MPFIVVLPHCAAQEKHRKHQGSVSNSSESFRGDVRQVHTLVAPEKSWNFRFWWSRISNKCKITYSSLTFVRPWRSLLWIFMKNLGDTKVRTWRTWCTWRTLPLNDSEGLLILPWCFPCFSCAAQCGKTTIKGILLDVRTLVGYLLKYAHGAHHLKMTLGGSHYFLKPLLTLLQLFYCIV